MFYCLTIKGSKLCCTNLQWSIHFFQPIVKDFHIVFFCCLLQFFSLCFPLLRLRFSGVQLYIPSTTAQFCPAWSSYFTLALVLFSNKVFSFLLLPSNQSWCLRLGLPKTLTAVSYVIAFKEFQFFSTSSDSWFCNPAKALSFSFVNFCWLSLSRSWFRSYM